MTDTQQQAKRYEYETESWPIEKVIPYEKNAKNHNQEQIDRLAAIIDEFGFRQPIVVDEKGVVLAGHGRRLAALQLGHAFVPVNVARYLTEKQKKAYRISDNMVARGSFDEDLLGQEIIELSKASEFDLAVMDMTLLGMSDAELGDIYAKFGDSDDFTGMVSGDIFDHDHTVGAVEDELRAPEREGVDYEKSFSVIIDCSGESEQQELYEQLTAEGRKCKIMTM